MPTLTTDQVTALNATLTQMQNALDQLMLGQMATEIRDQNGELMKFAVSDPEKLRLALMRRIIGIQAQLGIPTGYCRPAHVVVRG
jgi:hypothetical protein